LDEVSNKLLETETMSREEFEAIFPPPKPKNRGIPTLALA
jgi:cell division protease FtsH